MRFKRAVIVALILMGFGCSYGIFQVNSLSKQRKIDSERTDQKQCWAGYNNRVALRALIVHSVNQPINPNIIKDPIAKRVLIAFSKMYREGAGQASEFKAFAFDLLPLSGCTGINPDPPPPEALLLAEALPNGPH